MIESGVKPDHPRYTTALFLISCLSGVGLSSPGFSGPLPLSAVELRSWAAGAGVEIGCIDFQDILNTSREYVHALQEFDGSDIEPPWSPDLTEEEEAALIDAQERAWDAAMGVA